VDTQNCAAVNVLAVAALLLGAPYRGGTDIASVVASSMALLVASSRPHRHLGWGEMFEVCTEQQSGLPAALPPHILKRPGMAVFPSGRGSQLGENRTPQQRAVGQQKVAHMDAATALCQEYDLVESREMQLGKKYRSTSLLGGDGEWDTVWKAGKPKDDWRVTAPFAVTRLRVGLRLRQGQEVICWWLNILLGEISYHLGVKYKDR
jgi:hypothetical protein